MIHDQGTGNKDLTILNLNNLPSLKVIEFKEIWYFDVDIFIEGLSSYNNKIEHIIFTDCQFITNRFHDSFAFNKLKSYCDEKNIKLELEN